MKNLTQVAAGHTCKVAWIIGSFENIIRSFDLAEEQTLYILQNAGAPFSSMPERDVWP